MTCHTLVNMRHLSCMSPPQSSPEPGYSFMLPAPQQISRIQSQHPLGAPTIAAGACTASPVGSDPACRAPLCPRRVQAVLSAPAPPRTPYPQWNPTWPAGQVHWNPTWPAGATNYVSKGVSHVTPGRATAGSKSHAAINCSRDGADKAWAPAAAAVATAVTAASATCPAQPMIAGRQAGRLGMPCWLPPLRCPSQPASFSPGVVHPTSTSPKQQPDHPLPPMRYQSAYLGPLQQPLCFG